MKSIHETYGFMIQRGYEVFSADDYDMGWQVVLRKQDLYARIIRSRGEEEIYFRTSTQSPDEFTDIGSVIYAATGAKIPRWESSEPKVIPILYYPMMGIILLLLFGALTTLYMVLLDRLFSAFLVEWEASVVIKQFAWLGVGSAKAAVSLPAYQPRSGRTPSGVLRNTPQGHNASR